jgi:hypothetical protein
MLVEIEKNIKQVVTIDIELPYYYKHVLSTGDRFGDGMSVVYGKIEDTKCSTIQETSRNDVDTYEIEIERYLSIKTSGLSSYFSDYYKSNKDEYDGVKESCKNFLNKL